MTNTEDPPSLAERYGRAIVSSHLRLEEGHCDVDLLIAAGWLKDGLGAMLYRLRGEFDTVRASVRRGPLNTTEMLLVLVQLKTLHATKQAFGEFAEVMATRSMFMQPAPVVASIAGRVLTAWLDQTCHSCEGRGFNGGTHRGEQTIKCRACAGTGQSRSSLGDSAEDRRFARLLLDMTAGMLGEVELAMKASLRQHAESA